MRAGGALTTLNRILCFLKNSVCAQGWDKNGPKEKPRPFPWNSSPHPPVASSPNEQSVWPGDNGMAPARWRCPVEILGSESAVYFQLSFWREVQQLSLQSPFLGCSKLICAEWKVREELLCLPSSEQLHLSEFWGSYWWGLRCLFF